jgi:hypothetical protein
MFDHRAFNYSCHSELIFRCRHSTVTHHIQTDPWYTLILQPSKAEQHCVSLGGSPWPCRTRRRHRRPRPASCTCTRTLPGPASPTTGTLEASQAARRSCKMRNPTAVQQRKKKASEFSQSSEGRGSVPHSRFVFTL